MQLDMHFYGVYAIARAAGIKPETARTIAYASQFVDDAIDDKVIVLLDQKAVLPIMTSHKPLDFKNAMPDDQWKVWIPFHFLPGNSGHDFVERMACRKNSEPAKKMIRHALDHKNKEYWPHLIGLTAHVYADTFSHFGFVGFSHNFNKAKSDSIMISEGHSRGIIGYVKEKFEDFKTRFAGNFAEIVPIGHGSVATYPDRPYLDWSFKYESGNHEPSDTNRNNLINFHEGCKCLYDFFYEFAQANLVDRDHNGHKGWDVISDEVKNILKEEGQKNERIESWKKAIKSGVFCVVTSIDKEIDYNENDWKIAFDQYKAKRGDEIKDTDAYRFIRAAQRHRDFVLRELLPDSGLIIY